MAINGVAQFTLAELKTNGSGANQLGSITDGEGDTVTVRDRWNSVAICLVTDHPASGTDGVIFENKHYLGPWVYGGAKLGTAVVTGNAQDPVVGQDIVIPVDPAPSGP